MNRITQNLITPQNIDAERALLSCIMIDSELLYNLKINEVYFYKPEHRELYKAIYKLFAENKPINVISIKEQLLAWSTLEQCGGEVFISMFPYGEFSTNHADYYLGLIKDAYTKRNIISLGSICVDTGYNPNLRVDVAKERVSKAVDDLFKDEDLSSTFSLAQLVDQEWKDLNFRTANPDKIGIPTGFRDYDLLTGGLHPTDMTIVAARTATGKTSLILKILLNMAKAGIPSYLWEFEMGRDQLIQRLSAIEAQVNLQKIVTGRLSQEEYNKVVEALKVLNVLPIYIETDVTASIFDIMTKTRQLVNKFGVKVVAIDHVQLMPDSTENETQELGHISRQLKKLAMELGIVSLVVSQLNRNLEKRADRRPMLSDLRQSGNLEENANQVLFLHQEGNYDKDVEPGLTEWIIAKNRNGPTGLIPLYFDSQYTDFKSYGNQ